MFRFFKIIPAFLILASTVLVALYGCGGGGGTGPGYDVRANLNMGWQYFADAKYDSGIVKFSEVMDSVGDNAEALRGRGWCYAFLTQLSSAASDLNHSLDLDEDADAYMGLAAVYRDIPDLLLAISNASDVIDADSLYVFSRRTSIDYMDARLIRVQCYYRLGSTYFDLARTEVNYLCAKLNITPLPEASSVGPEEFERLLVGKIQDLTKAISD